jgi:hypothetical protein
MLRLEKSKRMGDGVVEKPSEFRLKEQNSIRDNKGMYHKDECAQNVQNH